ncbi:MAG TPA: signal peptide peptidase SppA [Epulopiscium sp.]|nr:signal peptide peptidase SppA [Candidatus Epulonipiscium sp.]
MTNKRWLAIGLAMVMFVVSIIIPATAQLFIVKDEKKATGFFKELLNESLSITVLEEGSLSSRIAVIDVEGEIIDQTTSPFAVAGYNHKKILANLEQIKTDETIKALILRVNSPGGGVYESAELTNKIIEVKEIRDIPVYTVMGSVAASGGYYIAANSEKIYAQAETLTGSIGVIMQGFNVTGLLDKLGIEDRTIKSGDLKDLGSMTRENTSEELAVMQGLVDNMYERFIDTVESGRELSRDDIYTLADGRIYDGTQAVENGLIDELGYFKDALMDLRESYSLEDAQVISFEENDLNRFSNLFLNFGGLLPKQTSPLPEINTNQKAPQMMYIYKGV